MKEEYSPEVIEAVKAAQRQKKSLKGKELKEWRKIYSKSSHPFFPFEQSPELRKETLSLLDISSEIENRALNKLSELKKEKSLTPIVKEIGEGKLGAILKLYYWYSCKKEEMKEGGRPHCPRPDFKKEIRSIIKGLDSLREKKLIKNDSLTKIGYILIDDLSHNPQELAWRMADLSKKSQNGRPKEFQMDHLVSALALSFKGRGRIDWGLMADAVRIIERSMERYEDLAENLRQRYERFKKNSTHHSNKTSL